MKPFSHVQLSGRFLPVFGTQRNGIFPRWFLCVWPQDAQTTWQLPLWSRKRARESKWVLAKAFARMGLTALSIRKPLPFPLKSTRPISEENSVSSSGPRAIPPAPCSSAAPQILQFGSRPFRQTTSAANSLNFEKSYSPLFLSYEVGKFGGN